MGTHCLLPRRGCDFGGKQAYFLTEVILTVSGDLRTDAVLVGVPPQSSAPSLPPRDLRFFCDSLSVWICFYSYLPCCTEFQ